MTSDSWARIRRLLFGSFFRSTRPDVQYGSAGPAVASLAAKHHALANERLIERDTRKDVGDLGPCVAQIVRIVGRAAALAEPHVHETTPHRRDDLRRVVSDVEHVLAAQP